VPNQHPPDVAAAKAAAAAEAAEAAVKEDVIPAVDLDSPLWLVWRMLQAKDRDAVLLQQLPPQSPPFQPRASEGGSEAVVVVAQPQCARLLGEMVAKWGGLTATRATQLLDSNILGALSEWLTPSGVGTGRGLVPSQTIRTHVLELLLTLSEHVHVEHIRRSNSLTKVLLRLVTLSC
jgi:hypothetical protein